MVLLLLPLFYLHHACMHIYSHTHNCMCVLCVCTGNVLAHIKKSTSNLKRGNNNNNNHTTAKWSTTISKAIIRLQLINKSKRTKQRRHRKNSEIEANERSVQVRTRMRIFAYFYRFLSMFGRI